MLSLELQKGKAAEHLVCAALILQGVSAFLADQGLPYDVIADDGQRLYRVQVRAAMQPVTVRDRSVYRFHIRKAKGHRLPRLACEVDVYAFVALDQHHVAYFRSEDIVGKSGLHIIQCMEFGVRPCAPLKRKSRTGRKVRLIADFKKFPYRPTAP